MREIREIHCHFVLVDFLLFFKLLNRIMLIQETLSRPSSQSHGCLLSDDGDFTLRTQFPKTNDDSQPITKHRYDKLERDALLTTNNGKR